MRLGPDLLTLIFLLLLQFASANAAVGDDTGAIDGQEVSYHEDRITSASSLTREMTDDTSPSLR